MCASITPADFTWALVTIFCAVAAGAMTLVMSWVKSFLNWPVALSGAALT